MEDKVFLKQLGLRLKCAMVMAETNPNAISKKCGLHRSSINGMVAGKKGYLILNLKKVTDAIGIEIKDIL